MTYKAEIIADSLAENGVRLTTMQVTFPRFILAEFNTHRAFSRNSASSRAIPVRKMIDMVDENPFIPEQFLLNKKGMQGGDPLEDAAAIAAQANWLGAKHDAVTAAMHLDKLGVHKQYVNRLLEPFLWHTAVVTATDWSNFFAQRCHPDAQPEIRRIAEMMRDVLEESTPMPVTSGLWHLPYISNEDREWAAYKDPERVLGQSTGNTLTRISVARCARVSYLSQNGMREIEQDIALYERLVNGSHWSPFEHIATPAAKADHRSGNFRGWIQFRKEFANECR